MSVGKGKADNISMEIDTGATRSTISESAYMSELANMYPLKKCDFALRSYTGELIPTLGYVSVPVKFKSSPSHLADIIVVQGKCPSLFGRDLLQKINLDWNQIFTVKSEPQLRQKGQNHLGDIGALRKSEIVLPTCQPCDPEGFRELLEKHRKLFSDKDTGIKDFTASLKLKPNAKSTYQKSRAVPYSMVDKVEQEYNRLIEADILTPVTSSKWASPTVHVPKANGSVRVCGDYKQVNSVIEDDGYKLPNVQDLFAKLAQEGSQPKVYSVIDLTGAFNQLFLDAESAQLLVLNTHKGLLAPKRLCFGVKTAPVLFQSTMDKILTGIPHVFCYVDDILVATNNVEEHLKILRLLFDRLDKYNVRLNASKCQFFKPQVQYLGHDLSGKGIQPVQDKIEAIMRAPRPTNVSELKSFLGIVNYYGKFVENLASKLHPL
ncbi:hypothetical protein BSL78_19832 [Apostichopus japonicus]|uniref:Reverse transcriptase domain-containing protein n=1 Tax=Stichopus japonicus TaxID=307972 RepID=A0A2G8K5U1_STIJA|nr:hypothetical protein BSL78_19832 [Apostichopus japonicus]